MPKQPERELKVGKPVGGPGQTWVQTQRAAHEQWAILLRTSPRAAELLHVLVARVGPHNAVVTSQRVLAEITGHSIRTIQRAIKTLVEHRWIELRQIGPSSTVNAYVINDRVVWHGDRAGLRHSWFSAQVIVTAAEQPDEAELERQDPLIEIPNLYAGERQMPTGDGLPPPSQPALPGQEPDLPARQADIEDAVALLDEAALAKLEELQGLKYAEILSLAAQVAKRKHYPGSKPHETLKQTLAFDLPMLAQELTARRSPPAEE